MEDSGRERKPRARDLGIPFEGNPASLNAITDVPGVEVGYLTLISGEAASIAASPAVRTGVTAILPRGKNGKDPVLAGFFAFNGNVEMTGMHWVEESGFLEGPVMLTNPHSVGLVRDAVIKWQIQSGKLLRHFSLPVVTETSDNYLNDQDGFHISEQHVFSALEDATSGPIAEGNVGGGTGSCLFEWKGGTGTSSRKLVLGGGYTIGVLVQANFGYRHQAMIAGVQVGKQITDGPRVFSQNTLAGYGGSIIAIIATDAPLLPHQLKRLAKRATVGLARTGGTGYDGSGDIFLAFSTANPEIAKTGFGVSMVQMLSNSGMDRLIDATAYATEEAIVNALVAAETMVGYQGHRIEAISHQRLQDVLKERGVIG